MDFLKLAKEYKQQAIELLTKLVQIDTVLDPSTITKEHPFGKGINDCLEYFLDVAKQDGFETLNDEGYAGRITYKGTSDESIAVLGHLDVVPTGEGWTYPPFSATIIDNKMYGRGTMDDKGPVVASYIALKILKEQGIKLTKNIEFILGSDEETGWRGLEHFQKNYQLPDTGFSPDAEFPLINGEKGIMRMILKGKGAHDFILKGGSIFNAVIGKASLTLTKDLTNEFNKFLDNNNLTGNVEYIDGNYIYTVNGKTAHAMCPQEGINAGTYLASFLNQYVEHPSLKFINDFIHLDYNLQKLNMNVSHDVMGIITNNVGIIDFNNQETKFTFDIRYPIGFDFNNFEEAFTKTLNEYNITFEIVEQKAPHYVDLEDDLVKTLYKSYVKYTNDTVNKPMCIGGGTYARALKHGVAYGMEEVGQPSVAHMVDEFIDLDKLERAIAIYLDAIYELGK